MFYNELQILEIGAVNIAGISSESEVSRKTRVRLDYIRGLISRTVARSNATFEGVAGRRGNGEGERCAGNQAESELVKPHVVGFGVSNAWTPSRKGEVESAERTAGD